MHNKSVLARVVNFSPFQLDLLTAILTIKLLTTKTLHVKLLSLGPNIIDRPVSIVSEFISLSKKSARRQPNYRSTKPQWGEIVSVGSDSNFHLPAFSQDIYDYNYI